MVRVMLVPLFLNSQHLRSCMSCQLRQAVVSAVYEDLYSKSTRSNNIIINGVPKDNISENKDKVEELFEREFDLKPTIKHCRRLGKPVANKYQNLLVSLKSLNLVNLISLKPSSCDLLSTNIVSTNVFINPDLTKAEHKKIAVGDEKNFQLVQRSSRLFQSSLRLLMHVILCATGRTVLINCNCN